MNRNLFLKACLAAGAFLSAPFAAVAKLYRDRVDKGIKVNAGQDRFGKPISLLQGDTFHTKVSTKAARVMSTFLKTVRINEGGPSFHLHYDQDEFWYITKGESLFKVGEETFTG